MGSLLRKLSTFVQCNFRKRLLCAHRVRNHEPTNGRKWTWVFNKPGRSGHYKLNSQLQALLFSLFLLVPPIFFHKLGLLSDLNVKFRHILTMLRNYTIVVGIFGNKETGHCNSVGYEITQTGAKSRSSGFVFCVFVPEFYQTNSNIRAQIRARQKVPQWASKI